MQVVIIPPQLPSPFISMMAAAAASELDPTLDFIAGTIAVGEPASLKCDSEVLIVIRDHRELRGCLSGIRSTQVSYHPSDRDFWTQQLVIHSEGPIPKSTNSAEIPLDHSCDSHYRTRRTRARPV